MMFSISRMSCTSPSPRTTYCSDSCSMKLPLALALFFSSASKTWARVTPNEVNRSGFTITWYCFTRPPKEFTSVTPGTVRRIGLTI